jgi:hypothetical protein
MTLAVAGARLGLSTGRLRQLIAEGRLHARKRTSPVGPYWDISAAEVKRFAALNRPPGRPRIMRGKDAPADGVHRLVSAAMTKAARP